jgi:hypothetical protein
MDMNHVLGTGFLSIRESYQQLRGFWFVSDGMAYVILRGHCLTYADLEHSGKAERSVSLWH